MSDYTQITDFSAKDALPTGDPEKVATGTDIDAELNAIATAIASKLNSSGYTAADVLAKLLTVDGASSGLDADSVDAVGPFAVGTWSPSFTAISNCSGLSSNLAAYIRIGSVVICIQTVTLTVTAGATMFNFRSDIPVASAFTTTNQLAGTCMETSGSYGGSVQSNAATDEALFTCDGNGVGPGGSERMIAIYGYTVI